MSGILAAAQSSGCCCRPQEGCTCSNPNRPGAIIDRGLSSVLVTSGFGIDEARRANYSPFDCTGCPCTGTAVYGPYSYQLVGSIIDLDLGEGDCEGRGCTNGPCPSAPTYSCSAEVGEVVAYQQSANIAQWRSRITFLGENKVGQWTWAPQRVGWCPAFNNPQVRVRRFFPFIYSSTGEQAGDAIVDPAGAFININTGEYASTPYGDTIGRIIAVADVEVNGIGPTTPSDQCSYYAIVNIHYVSEWMLRRFFAVPFFVPYFIESYGAVYRKPCVAPTDTVLGTYQLFSEPDYDKYDQDPSCGAIAGFHERRQTVPQTLTIS